MSNEKKIASVSTLSRRSVVRSIVGLAAGGAAAGMMGSDRALASTARGMDECTDFGRTAPFTGESLELDVTPRKLRQGDMLVTDQYNARVYLMRDRQVQPFIDVNSWGRSHLWDSIASPDRKRVYISMSGLRGPVVDYVGIKGMAMILEVDPESGEVVRTFSSLNEHGWPNHRAFIDVTGMAVTADGKRLLANDFVGFAHKGTVLQFDLEKDGEMSVLAEGLMEPCALSCDGPDHVLIGNSRMPGGAEMGGEIVRMNVHTAEKESLFDLNTIGALIGAIRLADGTLVASISDWPDQVDSKVIRIDGPDKHTEILTPDLAFFSAQMAPDPEEGFWVAESVTRSLYRLDKDGKMLEEVPVDACRSGYQGPVRPLARAFDTLESIRLVA